MNRHIMIVLITVWVLGSEPPPAGAIFPDNPVRLHQCIRDARRNNPELAATRASTDEAGAAIDTARSQLGPSVNLKLASRIQSDIPEMNQPATRVDTPLGDLTIPGRSMKLGSPDAHSLDLEITQVLYAGGRLTGRVDSTRLSAALTDRQIRLAERNVDTSVALQFLGLYRLTELAKTTRESLALAGQHAQDIRNLFDAGVVTRNEVLKAELRVSEAESRLIDLEIQTRIAAEQLSSATGRSIEPGDLQPPGNPPGPPPLPGESVQRAVLERTDLQILKSRQEILAREADLVDRERRPVISVFGRASYGKPGLDFIADDWADSYVAGLQCDLNAWDNHRRSSRLAAVMASIRKLESQADALKERIRLEVVRACLTIEDALKKQEVARRALAQSEENFRITSDKFHEGVLTNTDFLDAEIALSKASADIVISETDVFQSWIEYYTALGVDLLEEELFR